MTSVRIHRRKAPVLVESSPVRVRRTRSAAAPNVGTQTANKTQLPRRELSPAGAVRVRRVRPANVEAAAPAEQPGRPYFVMDWAAPLARKFSIYMVASYIYYELNRSILLDREYDLLCVELSEGFDSFEHIHKHLTDREQLLAGTGYAIKKYPLQVQHAAAHMLTHYSER